LYLAAKVCLVFPNGLADLYISNKNYNENESIDGLNYNLYFNTPEKFKDYFLKTIKSENDNVINNDLENNEEINENTIVRSRRGKSIKIIEHDSAESLEKTIKDLLDREKTVNLKKLVQNRLSMSDLNEFREDIDENENILFPKLEDNRSWEMLFEENMNNLFESIDEMTKNFYKYVISLHIIEMRNEIINYNKESLKKSTYSSNSLKEIREFFEFKYMILIISRIYNFISGVSINFNFLNNDQLNLRFYTDEFTYAKIAEFDEYPLQLKPYALKYAILEKKCILTDDEIINYSLNKKSKANIKIENTVLNIMNKGLNKVINKNNIPMEKDNEKESLIKTKKDLEKEAEKVAEKVEQQLSPDLSGKYLSENRISSMKLEQKKNILSEKIKEMNEEFRNLKQTEFDKDNHLKFPPYYEFELKKYEKFRLYDSNDEFYEDDKNCDFVNCNDSTDLKTQEFESDDTDKKNSIKLLFIHESSYNLYDMISKYFNNQLGKQDELHLIEGIKNFFSVVKFPMISKEASVFRSIDKLRLLSFSLDYIFRIERLKNKEYLKLTFFNRNKETQIYEEHRWRFFFHSLNVICGKNRKIFLNYMRNQLGEEISFYLLWLHELIKFLIVPSILGVVAYILISNKSDGKKIGDKIAFKFFVVYIRASDLIQFFICIVISFWCFIFLNHWKSQEKYYSYIWGCSDSEELERQQESYVFDKEISFIFDWKIKMQNRSTYAFKKIVSLCISFLLVAFVIFLNFYILDLKKTNKLKFGDFIFWDYFPTVLNAVVIKIMSYVYRLIASKLSYWENHEKNSKRIENLSLKVFIFEFVNNFFTYFYIGFYKSFKKECSENDCTREIEIQSYISLSIFASINLIEIGIPIVMYMYKIKKINEKKQENSLANKNLPDASDNNLMDPITSDEIKADLVPFDNLIEDYIEIIIYLAYVLLITSAAPLTPLFILILLMSERSVDSFKINFFLRVENLNSSNGISIYNYLIRIILFIGTITNLGLVLFSREYDYIDPSTHKDSLFDYLLKFLILLIFENFIFLTGNFIRFKNFPDCKFKKFSFLT